MARPRFHRLEHYNAVVATAAYQRTLVSMREASASTAQWLETPPWDLPIEMQEVEFSPEDDTLILGVDTESKDWRLDIASLEDELRVDVGESFVFKRDPKLLNTHRHVIDLLTSEKWDSRLRAWAFDYCARMSQR